MWRRNDSGADQGVEPIPADQQPAQQQQPRPEREREHRRNREERAMADNEVTVVGQGARLEGTVVSAGSLRVDGSVKGQINADGDVMLSPQSQVEADIRAENVVVAGKFTGNIFVKGKAELARGGRIDGNVTSKVLVIQEGGVFCGQSVMDEQAQAQQASAASQGSSQPATTQTPSAPSAPPAPGASGGAVTPGGGGGSSADTKPGVAQPARSS
jgi:cytoskeletal protein CcmA (bactofilin family)